VEYKLRENGIQTRRFSCLKVLEAGNESSGMKGPEILSSLGVGTCHRSDTYLLIILVDSWFPVLCVPFFTICEAMEFAERRSVQTCR